MKTPPGPALCAGAARPTRFPAQRERGTSPKRFPNTSRGLWLQLVFATLLPALFSGVARGAPANGGFEDGTVAPWVLTGAGAVVSHQVFNPPIAVPDGQFMGYITTLNNEGAFDFGSFDQSPDLDQNGVKEIEYSALRITFTAVVPSTVCVDLNFLTAEVSPGSGTVNDADVFGVASGDVRTGPYLLLYATAPTNGSYTGTAQALPPSAFSDEPIDENNFGVFPTLPDASQFHGQTGFRSYCFSVGPGTHTWTFFVADSHTDGVASAMLIDSFSMTPAWGGAETIVQAAEINPGFRGSYPSYMTEYNQQLYFRGNSGLNDTELWRFDGAEAQRVADINPGASGSSPSYLVVINGSLYFDATVAGGGTRVHRYDGNTVVALNTVPGAFLSSGPWKPAILNGALYFWRAPKMYRFDGTNMSSLITPPWPNSTPVVFNGQLYYGAQDGYGVELWRFNGTSQTRVTDINPADGSANPEGMTAYRGALYFRARDGTSGNELWRYDGGTASRVADIYPGPGSSNPDSLTVYRDALYFQADDGVRGYELWQFDGTNVSLAADLNPNPIYEQGGDPLSDSHPAGLTVWNDKLYFSATDGTNYGLWRYDGTNAVLIGGGTSGAVNELVAFQNALYFDNDDGIDGRELWRIEPNPARRMSIAAAADTVEIQLGEAETGAYIIESSTDCQVWTPVYTNTPVNGVIRFTDPSAETVQRFYRAVVKD